MPTPRAALLGGLLVSLVLGMTVAPAPGGASTAASAATVPAAASPPTQRNRCARTSVGAPRCGVLWGAYLTPRRWPGVWRQPYASLERRVGRRLDIIKAFYGWDAHALFPNARQRAQARGGRLLEVSWNAYNYSRGTPISYRRIARGDYDAALVRPQARRLKRWGRRVVVDFQHEMDGRHTKRGRGTPAAYRAAFRHVVTVFRRVGATNVKWAWVSTGYRPGTIRRYWPGRSYVHWIGYDPYNFHTCHGTRWKSPNRTIAPFYDWVRAQPAMRGKPIMLGEYATVNGPRAGRWYRRLPAVLRAHPRIKAVIQWSSATSPRCNFTVTDSVPALRGFRAAGHSPYVLGRR